MRQLVRIGRRWWWLLLLAPLIAGATAYVVSDRQQPLYSASVVLRINPPVSGTLDVNAVRLSQELGETYRSLITFTPVLDQTIAALDLPYSTEELRAKVTASTIQDTQLVRVSVSDPDPDDAARMATTIGSEFIAYVNQEAQDQLEVQVSGVEDRILEIEAERIDLVAELETLQEAGASENGTRIDEIEIRIAQLDSQVETLQLQIENVAGGVASTRVQVTVSDPATPPADPYAPRVAFYTLLGAFVGLLIALGAVALLEYMDNSVKADSDFQDLTGTPLLTTIGAIPNLRPGGNQVYVVSEPRSPSAEAIRMLRANLEFAAAGQAIASLAITSSSPGEGKSTVSANLAVVMAQAGLRTIMIDADLRKPTQHRIFSIPNDKGLTRLLTHPNDRWQDSATRVAVPNLWLIPSGPVPPNPADLLSIDAFPQLLKRIGADADIVILDTPPVLAVSDPLVVARNTDAVLLVARSGQTRRDALRHSAEALRQGSMRVLGIVLNQQRSKDGMGYYYYEGYGPTAIPPQDPPKSE
ncbi:MAG: polysaccharide biosynthesis tyrosine autokinase [Chloroflexia bacterium]|nr:polysaccharide biosynthesis tyrosine autokinase [Chloroflexia bacterium]